MRHLGAVGVQDVSGSRPFKAIRAEVEARLAWVEKRMLHGVPPSVIDREGMARFGLKCTRTMRRYRAAVEKRWPPLTDEVARENYRKRLLARVEYGWNRCVRNEVIARKGGDIAAANGAVRTGALVLGVGAKVAGIEPTRKVEITKRTETQQQARERIMGSIRSKAMTADSETKGEA